jgi:hypothetical protein
VLLALDEVVNKKMKVCGYCPNGAITWVGRLDEDTGEWLFDKNLCLHHYIFFCDIMKAENIQVQDWDFEETTN